MILRYTIWGELGKIIRLGLRKGCVIPERFALLLIKQKDHNKRFGEFEYFGSSDVANKLFDFFWPLNSVNWWQDSQLFDKTYEEIIPGKSRNRLFRSNFFIETILNSEIIF